MAAACQVLVVMLGQSEGGGWLATRALRGNEVSARYTPRQDSSLLLLTAQLSAPKEIRPTSSNTPTRLNNLETLLLNTLQSLQTSPPSLAEINAAKRRVLGQMQFETETNAGLARAIGYADLVSGDTPEQFRAHVLQLTQLDLQKLGERYLAGKPYLRVRLLSADERTP